MATPQNLDEFIYEAQNQGQRKLRIAIVGDPSIKPWTVRVEAYNKLNFDMISEDETIFEQLKNQLSPLGFEVTIVERQPYPAKIDPQMAEIFAKLPPTGIKKGWRRKSQ